MTEEARISIPSAIRQRLNRLAHTRGVDHGIALQKRLLAELQRLAGTGASDADLAAHLDAYESPET